MRKDNAFWARMRRNQILNQIDRRDYDGDKELALLHAEIEEIGQYIAAEEEKANA